MTDDPHPVPSKGERRVQAVLALFRGEAVPQVSTPYRICRSDLYEFRRRALRAMREALADQRRGPRRAHHRLDTHRAQKVISLCQRHPTHSFSQVQEKLGSDAPCARTIQRIRARHGIVRVPKRAPPSAPARQVPLRVMKRVAYILKMRPRLGPERIMWDLQNGEQLEISTSTMKRIKRQRHEALHPAPPQPPPPLWRRYEHHHPHSLWHGDFMDKITLTYTKEPVHQVARSCALLNRFESSKLAGFSS